MVRRLGLVLCRLGWHRWYVYVGVDVAGGVVTTVAATACSRSCGVPMRLEWVDPV